MAGCGGTAGTQSAAPSTQGPPATGMGIILFVKGDNLSSIHADGTGEVQLTHETNSNFANNPAFSPDRSQIAYSRHVAPTGNDWGGTELHVMKADGSADRMLVPAKGKGERAENPAWAPDEKSIIFAHDVPLIDDANKYTGDTLTLDRVDLQSGAISTIAKNGMFPSVSATALVWETYDPLTSKFQLNIGAPDGSQPKVLISDNDFQAILNPRLSPDGKQVLFSGSGRTDSKLASVGGFLAQALNPLIPEAASAHGLPWDPWIIGADGHGLRKVVNIGSDEQALTWSPDGQTVAFANLSATYLVHPDGSGLNRLLTHGDPGGLDWIQ